MFNRKLQQDDDQNQTHVSVGGPEGADITVEAGGAAAGAEQAGESLRPAEGGGGEKQENIRTETKTPQKQQQQNQQQTQKQKTEEEVFSPKVYGYKIPKNILQNLGRVSSKKTKIDPNTGIGALYVFLDRIMRMEHPEK